MITSGFSQSTAVKGFMGRTRVPRLLDLGGHVNKMGNPSNGHAAVAIVNGIKILLLLYHQMQTKIGILW